MQRLLPVAWINRTTAIRPLPDTGYLVDHESSRCFQSTAVAHEWLAVRPTTIRPTKSGSGSDAEHSSSAVWLSVPANTRSASALSTGMLSPVTGDLVDGVVDCSDDAVERYAHAGTYGYNGMQRHVGGWGNRPAAIRLTPVGLLWRKEHSGFLMALRARAIPRRENQ